MPWSAGDVLHEFNLVLWVGAISAGLIVAFAVMVEMYGRRGRWIEDDTRQRQPWWRRSS